MSFNSKYVQTQISLGIKAYKASNQLDARLHFQKALREDTQNIPALLWLAFITPNYEKQVFLLERVLEIDPENNRAMEGLEWVKQQRQQAEQQDIENTITEVAPETQDIKPMDQEQGAESETDEVNTENIEPTLKDLKKSLNSSLLKKQAKKGTIAQRARRRIGPLIILLISGAIVILGLRLFLFNNQVSMAALAPSPTPSLEATSTITPTTTSTTRPSSTVTNTPKPPTATATSVVSSATPLPTGVISTTGPMVYQPTYPGERWIEVDVTKQTVTAWEGDKPIMLFTVSTGLPNTPTVLGQFRIYQKLTATRMRGVGYDLPNVPHTMYFHQGYALHGAYWHDNFGQPMSHGCVNLALPDAKKLFEWAGPHLPENSWYVYSDDRNLGTMVVVHQ